MVDGGSDDMRGVALGATELLPLPAWGRRFTAARTVRLGDVDQRGEVRFDAIARYLQDIATDDALDAGLANAMGWLVRRTMIRVAAPATLNEHLTLTTFCTGRGRSWAERRTSIVGAWGASIDGVSLWVQIDMASGRPARLGDDFDDLYGGAAGGRVVSSRLSLPKGPTSADRTEPWAYRATDVDPFGHVNNAAQFAVVERIVQRDDVSRRATCEIEFLAPAPADRSLTLWQDGTTWWLVDESPVTAFRLTTADG